MEKKLILVCGSGGVGKTTVSAALALKGALEGKKAIVLTIDPAKRLATSLGLTRLTHTATRIDIGEVSRAPLDEESGFEGELWAMMLDTKSTFDDLVIKYAPTKAVEKKILSNAIYQHLSDMIAGSQEYMAMEKLYELVSEASYDLMVIDTPPTSHAIDFLEAPERMINAIGHSMIHLLLKPAMIVGRSGLKLLEKGSQMIFKVFDRITGFAFLQDISEMLISFQDLLGGFQNRAGEVRKILEAPDTAFMLVCACQPPSLEEARFFGEKLESLNLPLEKVILNRVHPFYPISSRKHNEYEDELARQVGKDLAWRMVQVFESYSETAKQDEKYKKEVRSLVKRDEDVLSVPLFETDIHDIPGLDRLIHYL